jgi:hypothetical protein
MAVNGDRTSMVVVTFWDLIPGAEANSLFEPEIRAVMQDMMSGPPGPFEEYEVIAQI